jgi:hypothetical protein
VPEPDLPAIRFWFEGHSELVERDADPIMRRQIGGDCVVARRRFCMDACPAVMVRAEARRLRPRIGRSRALSRLWSDSIELFAYCSVTCRAAGASSSSTRG